MLAGCTLHYDARYGLQPKWATGLPKPAGSDTPCMMGAGYVCPRDCRRAGGAHWRPWEDTAGRWGFCEQALCVKAYLLGIPVMTNRDLVLAHSYRDSNPVPERPPRGLEERRPRGSRASSWAGRSTRALRRLVRGPTCRAAIWPASWPGPPRTTPASGGPSTRGRYGRSW